MYLAYKLLATHYTGSIGYYLFLFMQTQFQLGMYSWMHKLNIHFLANLQDLVPTLASFVLPIINAAKVAIKPCRFA